MLFLRCYMLLFFFLCVYISFLLFFSVSFRLGAKRGTLAHNSDVSRAMHATTQCLCVCVFYLLLFSINSNFLNHRCQFDSGCPHARQCNENDMNSFGRAAKKRREKKSYTQKQTKRAHFLARNFRRCRINLSKN